MAEKKQPKPRVPTRAKGGGAEKRKPAKPGRVTTAELGSRVDRLSGAVERIEKALSPQIRSQDVAAEEHALLNLLDGIVDRRTEGFLLPLTRLAVHLDRVVEDPEPEERRRLAIESREQLEELLDALGLERISPSRGDEFQPLLHESVREVDADDLDEGTVADVVRVGYRVRSGKVLLPARVSTTRWNDT